MNLSTRYRSHHDSQRALAQALGVERRRPDPATPALDDLLETSPDNRPRGVYVHVPLCDRLCSFCNMNRVLADSQRIQAYAKTLAHEFRELSSRPYVTGRPFDAVYFGGGTPTVFSAGDLEMVLQAVGESVKRTRNCEWTFESTLHNLDAEKVRLLEHAGVNRLSIGVQTFSERGRRLLGRSGDGAFAARRLEMIRAEFSGTLGVDIIYSYPNESIEEVIADANTIQRLDIDSVSFYSLMIHDGSALSDKINSGELIFHRDIDEDRHLHNVFYERLTRAGYNLLELTKVAKPGRDRYQYIRLRYANRDLLPVGNGAGGRVASHSVYRMTPERIMISRTDSQYDKFNELLGDLQFGRYDLEKIRRHVGDEQDLLLKDLFAEYSARGLLRRTGSSTWCLTPDGVFWGNNMAVDLLEQTISESQKTRAGEVFAQTRE